MREVKEETGLTITRYEVVRATSSFCLFICKSSVSSVKLSPEHREFKWITAAEAIKTMLLTKETENDIKAVLRVRWFHGRFINPAPTPAKPIKKKVEDDPVDILDEDTKLKHG